MSDLTPLPVERDSLALPALFTAFATVAIAAGFDRKESAALLVELKAFPLPESVEQAYSQISLAITNIENRRPQKTGTDAG